MPKDRAKDRHSLTGRLIRPDPPELWDRLGAMAGARRRNRVISALIAGYLDGRYVVDDEQAPPPK